MQTENDGNIVQAVDWDFFLAWLKYSWPPGVHMALVGPTGEGKTTFAVGVLELRKWVIALDPKGEDDTLSASGYQRITSFPLPGKLRNDVAEGKPVRLIVGGAAGTDDEERQLKRLMNQAVDMVRQQGGWTLYADEFQILADLRMFNLGKKIEQLLIAARTRGTSVITAFQAPAWVPRSALRQAGIVVVWPTRDRGMIANIAQAMGREPKMMIEAVGELPSYHVLVIPKNIHQKMMLVHPPAVN